MLNRLTILLLLVFSSVAIPMQNDQNYQTRHPQSVSLENCIAKKDKMFLSDDIINNIQESNPANCKN